MREMDRRVALLRLLLADIANREREAKDAVAQLRGQLKRIVDFTVQFNGGVANALTALAEVEERLAAQETMQRHLTMLRQRARSELDALVVTRGVADAQQRLAELEARRRELVAAPPDSASTPPDAELTALDAEMAELRATIQAASDAAARALTEGKGE